MLSLEEILERLNTEDESVEIEAKRGSDVGKSMLETISAFSNEPDSNGGYLVLGVVRNDKTLKYEVEGVEKLDDVKAKIATVCRNDFNFPISPDVSVEKSNNKSAIIVYIPEAQPQDKPVFVKSRGVKNGSFRRITSTDHHCSDEDLLLFIRLRNHRKFDETPLPETSIEDIEPRALQEYRRLRSKNNPTAKELTYSDEELLDSLSAMVIHENKHCATIAGILLFGKDAVFRRHFPMMRVDYLRIAGNEWMQDAENRYEYSLEMREALLLLIPRLINQIMEDIPNRFSLPANSPNRVDIPLIPYDVIREAVANAVMHRDYTLHSTIQVHRYSDRLEIINPGYSLIPEENLGKPGASRMRNPKIATVLHDLKYAETKGTGIRTMRTMMKEANLTLPIINSDRSFNIFSLTLHNIHFVEEEDIKWLENFRDCNLNKEEAQSLLFLKKKGFIDNAVFRSVNPGIDTLKASGYLRRLRDLDLLEQQSKGSATFYLPGKRFMDSVDANDSYRPQLPFDATTQDNNKVTDTTNSGDKNLYPEIQGLYPEIQALYPELLETLKHIGERTRPEILKNALLKLLSVRELRLQEIAVVLNRNKEYILRFYIRPLLREKKIERIQSKSTHRLQAYRTTEEGKKELE